MHSNASKILRLISSCLSFYEMIVPRQFIRETTTTDRRRLHGLSMLLIYSINEYKSIDIPGK